MAAMLAEVAALRPKISQSQQTCHCDHCFSLPPWSEGWAALWDTSGADRGWMSSMRTYLHSPGVHSVLGPQSSAPSQQGKWPGGHQFPGRSRCAVPPAARTSGPCVGCGRPWTRTDAGDHTAQRPAGARNWEYILGWLQAHCRAAASQLWTSRDSGQCSDSVQQWTCRMAKTNDASAWCRKNMSTRTCHRV